MSRKCLLLEFLILFGGGPWLILAVKQRLFFVLILWVGALVAWRALPSPAASLSKKEFLKAFNGVVARFAVAAIVLAGVVRLQYPNAFLGFPRERPWLWLAVMVFYPLLSVWPQEQLFRRFMMTRYERLFGSKNRFIVVSGLSFGYAHIIFLNPVAVILSAIGGVAFAATYARYRSLALVSFEHALYGCLIFTIGLGRFFFSGAAWTP